MKTAVIGIGNIYRSDDGAGIIAARRLKEAVDDKAIVLENSGDPSELMDRWTAAEKVIVVDAMCSSKSPGTVQRFNASEESLPKEYFHYSTHTFNIADVIELARVLNKLPKELIVFALEGKDFSNGEKISEEVDQAIDKIVEYIREELTKN